MAIATTVSSYESLSLVKIETYTFLFDYPTIGLKFPEWKQNNVQKFVFLLILVIVYQGKTYLEKGALVKIFSNTREHGGTNLKL